MLRHMASLARKREARRWTLEWLERNDLPEPDEVEYCHTCIRLLWHQPKLVLIVDLDEEEEPDDDCPHGCDG
jgi:hypothetical protein